MFKKSHVDDIYSLSPMQLGMLYHHLKDPAGDAYFQQRVFTIQGELDPGIAEQTMNALLRKYDILRTVFVYEKTRTPQQVVLKERAGAVYFEDLSGLPSQERETVVARFREEDRRRGFNLKRDILIRVAIFKLEPSRFKLVWSFHHIVMDGWCLRIIFQDWRRLYSAYSTGSPVKEERAVPFKSYIQWLERQDRGKAMTYWGQYLDGYDGLSPLPPLERSDGNISKKQKHFFKLSEEESQRIEDLTRQAQVTLNAFFQSVWGVLLQKLNDCDDVVYGVVVSGRPPELRDIVDMVGLFVNTVPARVKADPQMSFSSLLEQAQKDAIAAIVNSYVPLADIQNLTPLKSELFDHMMIFENYPKKLDTDKGAPASGSAQPAGSFVENMEGGGQTNYNFDITIYPKQSIVLEYTYDTATYTEQNILRLQEMLLWLIRQILDHPPLPLGRLEIVPPQEKQTLLEEFNATAREIPRRRAVHQLIEDFADACPDKIMAQYDDLQLSYGEADRLAGTLASVLAKKGITGDALVGVMMARSLNMMLAIMGVWKAGGAYIPIDANYPVQRMGEILGNSGCRLLLAGDGDVDPALASLYDGETLEWRQSLHLMAAQQPLARVEGDYPVGHLSYVIYTSGSTGLPKGVMVEHFGMMNHMQAKLNDLPVDAGSIVAQNASHTFDISVWQFFAAPAAGGTTIIYGDHQVMDPQEFLLSVAKDRLTVLEVVPSYLAVLLDELELRPIPLSHLDCLLVTGEEVKPGLVSRWFERFPRIKMINAYGPTEASDDITHHVMRSAPAFPPVPIGKPIQNTQIYIVDNNQNLCPIGAKGEIWVSGFGVGRGYINDKEKTGRAFIQDPFKSPGHHRLYKTGDIGSWNPDGTILFWGRKDHQVKVRGFRIELGEIERRLLNHPAVKEAVVVDMQDDGGNTFLSAYLTLSKGIDIQALKQALELELPDYMIPSYFTILDTIPLTANGKVDRKALPEPMVEQLLEIPFISPKQVEQTVVSSESAGPALEDEVAEEVLATASEEERKRILEVFNATKHELPTKNVIAAFEDRARQCPRQVAVRHKENEITFEQCLRRARLLALEIRERTGGGSLSVGLMMDNSVDLIVGLLGILRAGAVFVPIDSEYPPQRRQTMVTGADVRLLLTEKTFAADSMAAELDTMFMEELALDDGADETDDSLPEILPGDIAYIVFTSGSTGNPKGSAIRHDGFANLLYWFIRRFDLGERDRFLMATSVSFDLTLKNIFAPLMTGGQLCVTAENYFDPAITVGEIESFGITAINITPSMAFRLIEAPDALKKLASLRYVFFGGEAMNVTPLEKWIASPCFNAVLVNTYGPSECTGVSVTYSIDNPKDFYGKKIPIGTPIYNANIHIVNNRLEPVPIGVPGELCISGPGVGNGYVNDPELNREKFVDGMYRTGDFAQWLEDGTIEFLGRLDQQVKIRGLRIELGEIEALLTRQPGIEEAAVVVRRGLDGERLLCACLVGGTSLKTSDIREQLSKYLPLYMIPALFVRVERLPLNANRKVNRRLLASLDIQANHVRRAPQNDLEIAVAGMYAELLDLELDTVDADADFFALGGHSLKAMMLVSRLHKQLGRKVAIDVIFNNPTVAELAARLQQRRDKDAFTPVQSSAPREFYPLTPAQRRLYTLQQMDPASTAYNMLHLVDAPSSLEPSALTRAFGELAQRHEILRTAFVWRDEQPAQVVLDTDDIEIESFDGHTLEHFVRPFDLSSPPLLRVGLWQRDQGPSVLAVDMHHIVSDGVSNQLLERELLALLKGESLAPLPLQYRDYALWWDQEENQKELARQREFWLNRFSGHIPMLNLPIDFPRPALQTSIGGSFSFAIDGERSARLATLARSTDASLFMVMLGIFTILLSKLSGQMDIVVGTPVAGRRHADLEHIIGLFINTLALRMFPHRELTFEDYLKEVRSFILEAFENQEFPFEELVAAVEAGRDPSRNPLFDATFALDQVEVGAGPAPATKRSSVGYEIKTSKFELSLMGIKLKDAMKFTFRYRADLFDQRSIRRFAGYYSQLAALVAADPKVRLRDLDMMPPEERAHLLELFTGPGEQPPAEFTIPQLFLRQVERDGNNPALMLGESCVTYRQLWTRALACAAQLTKRGVGPDVVVGVLLQRSIDMVVAMMAVMAAGGAYLPLDPSYPQGRLDYMTADAGAALVLSRRDTETSVAGDILYMEDMPQNDEDQHSPLGCKPESLAYVIYTSGTSGRPKGVAVRQRSIVNTLVWRANYYNFGPSDVSLQIPSFAFDSSVEDIFTPLLSGARLLLVPDGKLNDLDYLETIINGGGVTRLLVVPGLYQVWLAELAHCLGGLTSVTVAGEQCPAALVAKHFDTLGHVALYNEYGPTENSVCSTCHQFQSADSDIVIGRPLPNTGCVIVDPDGHLCPFGVAGELWVWGEGLARGYLNKPELTAGRFVFSSITGQERRLYRTGDLAVWRADGNIACLGRVDEQVKIRGFRIEPEEIQEKIAAHPAVSAAVVLAMEEGGSRWLNAYIVAPEGLDPMALRDFVARDLPDYMIPARFIPIEHVPVTANGKVDRQALRQLQAPDQQFADYEPPREEIQKTVALAWQEVLSLNGVGIRDNFFRLGGDSIKALLVAARLRRARLKMNIRDLFLYPTIHDLTPHIQPLTRSIPQEAVSGEVPLTPIQHWFFDSNFNESHHFNQSLMLFAPGGLEAEGIDYVLKQICLHHDALRMIFKKDGDEARQWNRGADDGDLLEFTALDLRDEPEDTGLRKISETADLIQRSGRLNSGPLLRAGLFKTGDGDHLLVVIHHLVVDGVSWRILREDLVSGYEQWLEHGAARFPPKTDSFRYWSQKALEYSQSAELLAQLDYWRAVEELAVKSLPRETEIAPQEKINRNRSGYRFRLGKEDTAALVRDVHDAYNTDIPDVLLTALALAVNEWGGVDCFAINLEGHGRDSFDDDVDISRTVGWFTCQYPLIIGVEDEMDVAGCLKNVKEAVRRVPQKGVGYGMLRYLTPPRLKDGLVFRTEGDVGFNFHGVVEGGGQQSGLFRTSSLGKGQNSSPLKQNPLALDINGGIMDGSLNLWWDYNTLEYSRERIEALVQRFEQSLLNVIRHCLSVDRRQLTPSDLAFSHMTISQLDAYVNLRREFDIQNIYRLSPMQEGILFNTLKETSSTAYFQQSLFALDGDIDPQLLERCFNQLIQRYDILRTVFSHQDFDRPVQVVARERLVRIQVLDLSALDSDSQEAEFQRFKQADMERGFDFSRDLLTRVALVDLGNRRYRLLWSFHHILMDGWCLAIIFRDLAHMYRQLRGGNAIELEPAVPYSRYIQWLNTKDAGAALDYWREYLRGYDRAAQLPLSGDGDGYVLQEHRMEFTPEITADIVEAARRQGVTVNILMQCAWAVLLHKLTHTGDIVFGEVVSGRPPEIDGIERIIGLFINTVPVRIKVDPAQSFAQLLTEAYRNATRSKEHEFVSLAEIQAVSSLKTKLLDHIMVFDNYPVVVKRESFDFEGEMGFSVKDFKSVEQSNYDLNVVVALGSQLLVKFNFNRRRYQEAAMESLAGYLRDIVEAVASDINMSIEKISINLDLREADSQALAADEGDFAF